MDAHKTLLHLIFLAVLILAGCSPQPAVATLPKHTAAPLVSPTQTTAPQRTPTPAATAQLNYTVAYSPAVPQSLRQSVQLPNGYHPTRPGETPTLVMDVVDPAQWSGRPVWWVYALVAPFPTMTDGVRLEEILHAWRGEPGEVFPAAPLLMTEETRQAFTARWGAPGEARVKVMAAGDLLDAAWNTRPAWALIPFEELQPRWKVLHIDGLSPVEKNLDLQKYPLALPFGLTGNPLPSGINWLPAGNRDESQMTVVVMTGVTALVREIAERMEEKGVLYPAGEIGGWLSAADVTHISNEVSFTAKCPPPARRDPNFCSDPKYLELLDAVGTDVVELTGNHELDWGPGVFLETLKMYQEKGWGVYGGGKNLESARSPLLIEDHGNKLAFIGCNPAGPEAAWATKDQPGTATCDFDWLAQEVERLQKDGYLVIATLQHVEVCTLEPHLAQQADFGKLAKAGAVIVSGSQAHCPQTVAFVNGSFVHYGLGNLFFDQMDMFARRQFIDRHVIYAGRYISTELLTAELEDYARPRAMTEKERAKLLEDVFRAAGWVR